MSPEDGPLPGSPRSIQHVATLARISPIEATNETLSQELSRVNTSINTISPINQLPYETLVYIFALTRDDSDTRGTIGRLPWLDFCTVCRVWRDIILTSPTLWQFIDTKSNIAWIKLVLDRSSGATLDLHCLDNDETTTLEKVQILLPHSHRIRHLEVQIVDPLEDDEDTRGCISELFASLIRSGPMPLLEELEMSPRFHHPIYPSRTPRTDLRLLPKRLPKLRRLTLRQAVCPTAPALYSQLHTLTLSDCESPLPFRRFLDCLTACTSLQTLHLTATLGGFPDSPTTTMAYEQISLPLLHDLSLKYHTNPQTSTFLSALSLSPVTRVVVENIIDQDAIAADGLQTVIDGLPGYSISGRVEPFPIVPTVCDVDVGINFASGGIVECFVAGFQTLRQAQPPETRYNAPQAAVSLSSIHIHHSGGRTSTETCLHILAQGFRTAPIRSIVLNMGFLNASQAPWRDIFTAFPLLECLRISDGGYLDELFTGLRSASISLDRPADGRAVIACPLLTAIYLGVDDGATRVTATDSLLGTIAACLESRSERGSRLEILELYLTPADSFVKSNNFGVLEQKYLPRFQSLVGKLRYQKCRGSGDV